VPATMMTILSGLSHFCATRLRSATVTFSYFERSVS
jgi:hypothetical protein